MVLEVQQKEILVTDLPFCQVDFQHPDEITSQTVEMLQEDFFPDEDPQEVLKRYQKLTENDGLAVVSQPGLNQRGGEVYFFGSLEEPIGVLDLRYYGFETLAPQLYLMETTDTKGKTASLSLKPFGQIVQVGKKPAVVGELAYYLVEKGFREKGIGSEIFQKGIGRLRDLIGERGIVFTLAKTEMTDPEKGKKLVDCLLEKEGAAHGIDEEGKVVIRSLAVSVKDILDSTGIDYSGLGLNKLNSPTAHLAIEESMDFSCYSKKLSSAFVG